jgi:hypothetical protein
MYDFTIYDNIIDYIKGRFLIGNTEYCSINGHTIFIEFCNILDEYYVTKNDYEHPIMNYNDYKITWVSCGCSWNQGFPSKLINYVIQKELYTPTDINSYYSHLFAYQFNKANENSYMQPYCQGLYQILGTYLWRGSKDIHIYESVLLDLVPKLISYVDEQDERNELIKFSQREIRWNSLQRKIREKMNTMVFGKNITIS